MTFAAPNLLLAIQVSPLLAVHTTHLLAFLIIFRSLKSFNTKVRHQRPHFFEPQLTLINGKHRFYTQSSITALLYTYIYIICEFQYPLLLVNEK